MSYEAIVTPIKVRPHPNADRLQLGLVAGGEQVIVGLETKDGELGIYFPCDGQLSHEFCVANKLYRPTVAAGLGVEGNGLFEENRRVRAQKLRGEKSDGFWVPLSYLTEFGFTPQSSLQSGTTLTEFGGVEICNKYLTKATQAQIAKGPKVRKDTPNFPKHVNTMQFRFLEDLPRDSIIYVSEKLH